MLLCEATVCNLQREKDIAITKANEMKLRSLDYKIQAYFAELYSEPFVIQYNLDAYVGVLEAHKIYCDDGTFKEIKSLQKYGRELSLLEIFSENLKSYYKFSFTEEEDKIVVSVERLDDQLCIEERTVTVHFKCAYRH